MAADVQATEAEVVEACVHGGEKLQFASSTRGLKCGARGVTRNDYQRVWRAVKAAKDEKDALAQQKKSKMNNVRLTWLLDYMCKLTLQHDNVDKKLKNLLKKDEKVSVLWREANAAQQLLEETLVVKQAVETQVQELEKQKERAEKRFVTILFVVRVYNNVVRVFFVWQVNSDEKELPSRRSWNQESVVDQQDHVEDAGQSE